jgi:hypothetical protein
MLKKTSRDKVFAQKHLIGVDVGKGRLCVIIQLHGLIPTRRHVERLSLSESLEDRRCYRSKLTGTMKEQMNVNVYTCRIGVKEEVSMK